MAEMNPLGVRQSDGSERYTIMESSAPKALTMSWDDSLNANSSSCPGVSTRTYSEPYVSMMSVILEMLAIIRSAATIWAPLGPRPYSLMVSSRLIHSLMSTSALYGSASTPGSRLTTIESTPSSSSHCLYAPTRVLFPLPAVPTKNMYFTV